MATQSFKLNNGKSIPAIGLGTVSLLVNDLNSADDSGNLRMFFLS